MRKLEAVVGFRYSWEGKSEVEELMEAVVCIMFGSDVSE